MADTDATPYATLREALETLGEDGLNDLQRSGDNLRAFAAEEASQDSDISLEEGPELREALAQWLTEGTDFRVEGGEITLTRQGAANAWSRLDSGAEPAASVEAEPVETEAEAAPSTPEAPAPEAEGGEQTPSEGPTAEAEAGPVEPEADSSGSEGGGQDEGGAAGGADEEEVAAEATAEAEASAAPQPSATPGEAEATPDPEGEALSDEEAFHLLADAGDLVPESQKNDKAHRTAVVLSEIRKHLGPDGNHERALSMIGEVQSKSEVRGGTYPVGDSLQALREQEGASERLQRLESTKMFQGDKVDASLLAASLEAPKSQAENIVNRDKVRSRQAESSSPTPNGGDANEKGSEDGKVNINLGDPVNGLKNLFKGAAGKSGGELASALAKNSSRNPENIASSLLYNSEKLAHYSERLSDPSSELSQFKSRHGIEGISPEDLNRSIETDPGLRADFFNTVSKDPDWKAANEAAEGVAKGAGKLEKRAEKGVSREEELHALDYSRDTLESDSVQSVPLGQDRPDGVMAKAAAPFKEGGQVHSLIEGVLEMIKRLAERIGQMLGIVPDKDQAPDAEFDPEREIGEQPVQGIEGVQPRALPSPGSPEVVGAIPPSPSSPARKEEEEEERERVAVSTGPGLT